jgi:hypothetical protein
MSFNNIGIGVKLCSGGFILVLLVTRFDKNIGKFEKFEEIKQRGGFLKKENTYVLGNCLISVREGIIVLFTGKMFDDLLKLDIIKTFLFGKICYCWRKSKGESEKLLVSILRHRLIRTYFDSGN